MVTDEPVELPMFLGINCGIYLDLIKNNRKLSTCDQFDQLYLKSSLETAQFLKGNYGDRGSSEIGMFLEMIFG